MRQKDLPIILAIVIVSSMLSLLITKTLFVPKKDQSLTAEKVDVITSTFNKPDPFIFNKDAVNPTQLIKIGGNNNTNNN
ncbi:hypothetical protein A3F37_04020 [Candidatus Saccharibacteria bacterium RIFCSPHIGHO2_12_FULL_41_12]|nr:MAG: hypothetical protein A3F37_04020 [Candidatus Saccharibacteria bacterium RIFCSPHIGHO2_12_FULL_41_12]